jgi:hypothetical protein
MEPSALSLVFFRIYDVYRHLLESEGALVSIGTNIERSTSNVQF